MDPAHLASKLAIASYRSPIRINTAQNELNKERNNDNSHVLNKDYKNDRLEVHQPEPSNFKPVTDVERNELQNFTGNRNVLTAQFYEKLQLLKKEHQKTLAILHQFCDADGRNKNSRSHYIDDLEYTKHNTLLHEKAPSKEPDVVPGYSKNRFESNQYMKEKSDVEKEFSSSADFSSVGHRNAYYLPESSEVVGHMWDKFSVRDYMDKGYHHPSVSNSQITESSNLRPQSAPIQSKKQPQIKKKEWTPVITIPKPFSMTLREEGKKEKLHSRSSLEISLLQKMRQEEEAQELAKKVHAREPPAHIYLPLYQEICERQEQRSRYNKENSIATTLAIQKPFSFDEREQHKLNLKKKHLKAKEREETRTLKKIVKFEATPIPSTVYSSSLSDRMLEEDLYRKIKAKLRSEDLMKESSLPPRMHSHELMAQDRRQAWLRDAEKQSACSFRPRTNDVPDFDALHRQEQLDSLTRKREVETTVVEPFNLRTMERSKKRTESKTEEMKRMRESWEEEMKASRQHPTQRSFESSDTIPTRLTDSARLRIDNMRQSLENADRAIARAKEEERDRKERKKIMSQRVAQKAALNDTSSSLIENKEEKLRQYKKELRARQNNYNKFLSEVKQRVDQRPLLFEQHNQKVAKANAERRYRKILETSGLSDEFVENKSRFSEDSDGFEPLTSQELKASDDDVMTESDHDDTGAFSSTATSQKQDVLRSSEFDQTDDDVTFEENKEENSREEKKAKSKHVEFAQ